MRLPIATGWVEIGRCLLSVLAADSAYWPYVKTITRPRACARTATPLLGGGGGR